MASRREWDKRAKDVYGPTAAAVRVSNVLDRNQRFGIMLFEPGGLEGKEILVCLGYGKDFDSAWLMAESNEAAQMAANRWKTIQEDWKQFGENPQGYMEKFRKEMELYGRDQREGPEGFDHQRAGEQGEREG